MLKRNLGRIFLSCFLTLSYVWTACQKSDMKMEARQAPRNIKLEAKASANNQPIFAEVFSESRNPSKH